MMCTNLAILSTQGQHLGPLFDLANNTTHGAGAVVSSRPRERELQVTFYSNEKESLLSPGTELKVKSNKHLSCLKNFEDGGFHKYM